MRENEKMGPLKYLLASLSIVYKNKHIVDQDEEASRVH